MGSRALWEAAAAPVDSDTSLAELCHQVEEISTEEAEGFLKLQSQLTDLGPAVHQLHKRYSSEGHLTKEWGEVTREMADISTGGQRATTYVTKLKESWQHLLRDRASRTLTYNDEQFHILEKIKMQETIRVLMDLLQTGVQPVIHQLTDVLADWYKMAQTTFLQTEILHKDIGLAAEEVDAFLVTLKGAQEQYNNTLNEAIDGIKSELEAQ